MTHVELCHLDAGGERLHGLVTPGRENTPVAIHLHGTGGNFYENTIATCFAPTYQAAGYRYAAVNLPGHDGGSVGESFGDSLAAISAWADHFGSDAQIVWQAHSLGALKIMQYLAGTGPKSVLARSHRAVLLSPCDLRAVYARSSNAAVISAIATTARQMVAHGLGSDIVPTSVFGLWSISWATFADALCAGGELDVFPTSAGSTGLLGQLDVPCAVFIGGNDFATSPDAKTVVDLISSTTTAGAHLISGAPHNFAGFEDAVRAQIEAFLR